MGVEGLIAEVEENLGGQPPEVGLEVEPGRRLVAEAVADGGEAVVLSRPRVGLQVTGAQGGGKPRAELPAPDDVVRGLAQAEGGPVLEPRVGTQAVEAL